MRWWSCPVIDIRGYMVFGSRHAFQNLEWSDTPPPMISLAIGNGQVIRENFRLSKAFGCLK